MANTRCGHTSMNRFFGLTPYIKSYDINQWYNTVSHRTMVLRNPMDRLRSAQVLTSHKILRGVTAEEWIARHSAPYLYSLAWHWRTWSYIPFEQLQDYIPYSSDSYVTHSVADPDDVVPEYLAEEMAAYAYIKQHMSVLTPAEWRSLTG